MRLENITVYNINIIWNNKTPSVDPILVGDFKG